MRTKTIASSATLVFAALLTVGSCGGSSQKTPGGSLRTDIGSIPPDMQSDYQSFAENCSKCHGLERALAAPVTDNRHWDVYVAKMMRTAGSAINADEAPHILRFLYWYTERKNSGAKGTKATSIEEATPPRGDTPQPAVRENSPPAAPADSRSTAPAPTVTDETQGESAP